MKFTKKLFGDPIINAIIAKAEGQKTHTRPYVWECGDKQYTHITGGIVLPTFHKPEGYLMTMAVNNDDKNSFECIEEFESKDAYALIKKAQDIQTEYGKGVIMNWWGNPEEMMSIVNEINISGNPVYISSPIDFNQKDAFQIYIARIKVSLSAIYKTLLLAKCNFLRNYIESFVEDKTAKAEDVPAMYICGAILHTLLTVRPWEQAVERIELIPTTSEDYAIYAHEKAEQDVFAYLSGGEV